jgi:outer membrane protein TolC
VFKDPVLDGLETQVASANLDIRAAVARYDQAEAGTKYARSFLFPAIGAGAAVSRTREAQNRPNNGNTNGLAATYNDIPVALALGYEVDVWGKIRRSLQSARALQQASADDLRFVKLSMEATTATDCYSLRENDAEQQVLQLTIQQLEQALELATNRFKGGLARDLDVEQARTLLLVRVERMLKTESGSHILGPPEDSRLASSIRPVAPGTQLAVPTSGSVWGRWHGNRVSRPQCALGKNRRHQSRRGAI